MKIYITFGQDHVHRVNNKTFDKDSVALIEAPSHREGRDIAVELFGLVWATSYEEKEMMEILHYFPRGIIAVN
jgi:hypothetical protein